MRTETTRPTEFGTYCVRFKTQYQQVQTNIVTRDDIETLRGKESARMFRGDHDLQIHKVDSDSPYGHCEIPAHSHYWFEGPGY